MIVSSLAVLKVLKIAKKRRVLEQRGEWQRNAWKAELKEVENATEKTRFNF